MVFHYCVLHLPFYCSDRLSEYNGGKQDTGDWVRSHWTYRSSKAAGSPVPGVLGDLSHHDGGQPWTDFSHLEGPSSSHTHVLISGQFSLCRCLFFILCDSQNANEFLIYESYDIPVWVHLPILYFCFQCEHRMFPPGGDGLWPLCGHMQPLALSSGDVQYLLHSIIRCLLYYRVSSSPDACGFVI